MSCEEGSYQERSILRYVPGAKLWEGGKHRRIYFDLYRLVGAHFEHYNTGNISGCWVDGVKISNSAARRMCAVLDMGTYYYDINCGQYVMSAEMSCVVPGTENDRYAERFLRAIAKSIADGSYRDMREAETRRLAEEQRNMEEAS